MLRSGTACCGLRCDKFERSVAEGAGRLQGSEELCRKTAEVRVPVI